MGEKISIRRCQHIKVNGTQCGSPALRNWPYCYFHDKCRPKKIKVGNGGRKKTTILLPPLEDANSIQFTLRQVAQLLLEEKISQKTAGLLLYTLQIASSNLKEMKAEKARPEQVVVDPDKVGETGIRSTPWWIKGDLSCDEDAGSAGTAALETIAVLWRKRCERAVKTLKWRAQRNLDDIYKCLDNEPTPEKMRSLLQRMAQAEEWRGASKSAGVEDDIGERAQREREAKNAAAAEQTQDQAGGKQSDSAQKDSDRAAQAPPSSAHGEEGPAAPAG